MNAKLLDDSVKKNTKRFHQLINTIKQQMKVDIYSISNITLIKNPYTSIFPLNFFLNKVSNTNSFFLFIKSTFKFYLKQIYFFFVYMITYLLYKVYYKKEGNDTINETLIDVFCLVQPTIESKMFHENYFKSMYPIFEKKNIAYTFIPRIYNTNYNPFSIIPFFKILSLDKRDFLFEFELLTFWNFIEIFWMILLYPFKTLRLFQKEQKSDFQCFNNALINDIASQGMNSFSRYVFAKNIAKLQEVKEIISWSEFQVIERSFNYGIRANNTKIKLIGCQFYLNYKTYFNAYVDDIDDRQKTAFHTVLVNGKNYLKIRDEVIYKIGVSLRYQELFDYKFDMKTESNKILVLGSYITHDTKDMLNSVTHFDNVLFKNHPAVNLSKLNAIPKNITIVDKTIYELFHDVSLVIATASGTAVEAVACGKSVIIIASQKNLTANPLVSYGKGKIWDIAFSKDDVEKHYNKLIKYRNENPKEIQAIAMWYKDNFFVEPTEENIIKAFELDKELKI